MILRPPQGPPRNPGPPQTTLVQAYALQTLARLPLAEAFYDLWAFLANDCVLDCLFDRYRGRCYEDKLAFSQLVGVLADALTRYHGSGRPAIAAAIKHQPLKE